ncbi:YgiQ family radical SAM protein [Heliobacterium gestii]|uniref:YgiQ family radical SAM protein n=1 Tax=Heliomicrobium gestii TaxID=2699 RepID=A0A845LH44_HELGE|nr:YgiQ family radical SAM protein [Heliomicrobium gestii]MBM7867180.1 putative radical SAM protein YgiQ [Heliomicrobium gestii]MZP43735.1 YgiQ family radical SAM protein [Heliomicrobium gestii]
MAAPFLPLSKAEMNELGWDACDFVLVTGDAYVDHPSFGAAIIGRVLESRGYRVGILSQPDWRDARSFKALGRPRLAWLVTAGNLDSMVNHYTAAKKRRSEDSYSPGGRAGLRPDRASLVYAHRCRQAFKEPPIILGGIEASLRRFAHYDYWDDKVRRSVLVDAKADVLVFGMGEEPITALAEELNRRRAGEAFAHPLGAATPGVCYIAADLADIPETNPIVLPSFDEVVADKCAYAKAFQLQEREQNPVDGKTLVQPHGEQFLVQNRPGRPLTTKEMDALYDLPFARQPHPAYEGMGGVPALEEVEFSLTAQRGCFGGCSFCALTFHQGRIIQGRSHDSLVREARRLIRSPRFKGYIHDVGGPTANFRRPACRKQGKAGACRDRQCLHPKPCPNLDVDHGDLIDLLRKLRALEGVKKVFIRSGLRFDYLMADKPARRREFLKELCEHHVSGQLKVAPEHASPKVLRQMGKPGIDVYEAFKKEYEQANKEVGREQYLVPYLVSSHPGADIHEAIELAERLRDWGCHPEQVQDFIPTPGSLSTCIYYTGIDPRTMEPVYVPRSPKEKARQRALLQFRRSENYPLVYQALRAAGRMDLVGHGPNALIRPPRPGMGGGDAAGSARKGRQETPAKKGPRGAGKGTGKAAGKGAGKGSGRKGRSF